MQPCTTKPFGSPIGLRSIVPAELAFGSKPFGSGPSSRSTVSPAVGSWQVPLINTVPPPHSVGSGRHAPVSGSNFVPSPQIVEPFGVQKPPTLLVPGPHSGALSPQALRTRNNSTLRLFIQRNDRATALLVQLRLVPPAAM